ncbi:MAG: N-acetylmuramoyl-L-alanine amidase [Bradymonadia bacterium]
MSRLRFALACALGACFMTLPVCAIAAPNGFRLESQHITTPAASIRPPSQIPSITPAPTPPIDPSAEITPNPTAPDDILPPPVRTIVIDPGHGGTNEGAIGVANIHEKFLTLKIALMLADRIRHDLPDVNVVLTRQGDDSISLADRIELANHIHADLFLSLHFNASLNPEAIGFESFWAGEHWIADHQKMNVEITPQLTEHMTHIGALSQRLANCFNRAMKRHFDVLDRGVKTGDYTVLNRAHVPAVVLELAFLSHQNEGIQATSKEFRAKIVDALFDTIKLYAGNSGFYTPSK